MLRHPNWFITLQCVLETCCDDYLLFYEFLTCYRLLLAVLRHCDF